MRIVASAPPQIPHQLSVLLMRRAANAGESEGTETWQDQQVLTLQDEYKALEQQLQAAKEENEKLRRARAHDTETLRRLQSMEGQVQVVVQELNAKERQLQAERKTLLQFQDLEKQVRCRCIQEQPQAVIAGCLLLEARMNKALPAYCPIPGGDAAKRDVPRELKAPA